MKKIVGFVSNLVPYHAARWNALGGTPDLEAHLVEITNQDDFAVLEYALDSSSFHRHTLFPGKARDGLATRKIGRAVLTILDQLAPDVVCLNGYWAADSWAAWAWCLQNGVPAVICSESNVFDQKRQTWKEQIKRWFVGSCSAGLAGGGPQRRYLGDLGLAKDLVFTGYDAVDNDHFAEGAAKARTNAEQLRLDLSLPPKFFLACTRFTEKKNLFRLIRAYGMYRRKSDGSPWALVIAGDGPLRGDLERLIEDLSLQSAVYLPGAQAYKNLPIYYGLATAFVHASLAEQWGLVVNEALAAGLPAIVSLRCGCAADLIEDGRNGFLFDPSDENDLADCLLKMSSATTDLAALGKRGAEVIAAWGPARFAAGLGAAMNTAWANPLPRRSLALSWLVKALFSI